MLFFFGGYEESFDLYGSSMTHRTISLPVTFRRIISFIDFKKINSYPQSIGKSNIEWSSCTLIGLSGQRI